MHDETKHPVTRNSEIIPGSRKASSSPNTKPTGNKDSFQLQIPQVSLPKGGGAIKSIDEKFQVNAVTGTANFSIPLPLSPSRNSFVPSIGLSYNSGNGNSIFGFGWNLDIPSITRKTEKELPRYEDANESDTFIFSGADDLVPVLSDAGARHVRMVGNNKHYSYYPRIEGNFSRVERVIEPDGNCFWQVTTKENITSIFGRSKNARIADPKDDSRIFKWLQEFSYDDKGNCYHLDHKQEDIVDVRASLHELNRLNGLAGSSNNYLKRIRYCNKEHFKKNDLEAVVDWKFFLDKMDYLLELVFDFGEHDIDNPMPDDKGEWKCRKDPFSDFRAGFEIRTYRTCKRVLMFHRFAELGNSPCLVRSMEMDYGKRESSAFTLLEFVIQTGYKKNGNIKKSLPALQFTYEPLGWNTTVKFLSAEDNGAVGVDDKTYQWMDFYGEGITGILTEQADAFYYKYNRGNGEFSSPVLVSPKPSFTGLSTGAVQLADIEANGKKFLVSHSDEGYFEMNEENEWLPFKNFTSIPNIDWSDPNLKMLDLNGDGLADILISEDDVFAWFAAKGKGGYNDHKRVHKSFDEDKGPAIVFNDITQSIVFADMSGDGLTDIVRIRNGEIVYWPNLGYGKFGSKISMSDSPLFDTPDAFNPQYIKLADIDGSGTTDIVYLGKNSFQVYFNQSGNSWSTANIVEVINPLPFPQVDNTSHISVIDLLGNGTSCIVWSSPLPANSNTPLRYIDLMDGKKPHLLKTYYNNLGKQVHIIYRSSVSYYLDDKKSGKEWITRLPFPVHCISKVETIDKLTNSKFTTSYRYRHGYYDHSERRFCGFGYVEQVDVDEFDRESLDQAPVITKTWFHTGAFTSKEKILTAFEKEYFYNQPGINFKEPQLQDAIVDKDLSIEEWREAMFACKGLPLRIEIFADDNSPDKDIPYTSAQHNCIVKKIQSKANNKYAVFMVHENEQLTYTYERNVNDPRIAHTLNTVFDKYGNIRETASVVYGRNKEINDNDLSIDDLAEQRGSHITYTINDHIKNDVITDDDYRLIVPCETKTFELTGYPPPHSGTIYQPTELKDIFDGAAEIKYEEDPTLLNKQKRLIENERHYFKDNSNDQRLSLGEFQSLALPYESYKLVYTISHAKKFSDNRFTNELLLQAGYVLLPDAGMNNNNPDKYWARSGRQQFDDKHFYQVTQIADPFDMITKIVYDQTYHFHISEVEDPVKNRNRISHFNFLVLSPERMEDLNGNISETSFDALGMVVGLALKGKNNEADSLDGFDADIDLAAVDKFFGDPLSIESGALLQKATSRFIYDLTHGHPRIATISREKHFIDDGNSPLQLSFEYYNGLGQVLQKKIRAEKGDALKAVNGERTVIKDQDPRWVGSGTIIYNNKKNPVKKYEEFFSTTHLPDDDESLKKIGVTPVIHYDPLNRVIKTVFPDGSLSKIEFSSWKQSTFDQNDTVSSSDWYKARTAPVAGVVITPEDADAANKAFLHDSTPTEVHLDSLGRTFLTLTVAVKNQAQKFRTKIIYDIEGNQRKVIDARSNPVMQYEHDMTGNKIKQVSMDAGVRIMLNDVTGKPFKLWDSKNQEFTYIYDELRRPTEGRVKLSDGRELLFDKKEYGDDKNDPGKNKDKNLRGQLSKHYDGAGLIENEKFDFKSNLESTCRKVLKVHEQEVNWKGLSDADLADEKFLTIKTINKYDALNRVIESKIHENNIIKHEFNIAGLLEKVFASVNGGPELVYVEDINYNEKGQRNEIRYGNGTVTKYFYDEKTFQLKRLTTSGQDNPGNTILFQDLQYTYDPAGNITQVKDNAQPTIYFGNTKVQPICDYEYDALYQLIKVKGREHIGQNAINETNLNTNYQNFPFDKLDLKFPAAADMVAMRNYTQEYSYDEAGNITVFDHQANGNGYKRTYRYNNNDADRLACGVNADRPKNNQLLRTTVKEVDTDYMHDAHGNMTSMPHLSVMDWNYKDQLKKTAKTVMNDGKPGTTFYVYDSEGIRVRKITHPQGSGVKREERIYINGFELYIRYDNDDPKKIELKRETLHIMDDKSRVAMIETKTEDNRNEDKSETNKRYTRYQYSNHLGSACFELTEKMEMISYEEYHPYGTTSFQLMDKTINPVAKRYRYTGLERDEENGFGYHNARYYAGWLGRWVSCDPISINGGPNQYEYASSHPIKFNDRSGFEPQTAQEVANFYTGSEQGKKQWASKTDDEKRSIIRSFGAANEKFFTGGGTYGIGAVDKNLRRNTGEVLGGAELAVSATLKAVQAGGSAVVLGGTLSVLGPVGKVIGLGLTIHSVKKNTEVLISGKEDGKDVGIGGRVWAGISLALDIVTIGGKVHGLSKRYKGRGGDIPDDMAGLNVRRPNKAGQSVGQQQGREWRKEALGEHEFDKSQPAHVRGWLRNERRRVDLGQAKEQRNPPGYVLAHGRQTPAREGFDYSNSRLTHQDLNALEEIVRRVLGRP